MKTSAAILALLLAVSASAQDSSSTPTYRAEYEAGIQYFEQGHLRAASDALFEAISLSPTPSISENEYLPYIYFSAAQFEMGNTLEARDALVKSQVYGIAAKTESGKLLLDRYAVDIMSASLDNRHFVPSPKAEKMVMAEQVETPVQEKVVTASVEDVPSDKQLKRCVKAADKTGNDLPWHFHYKCGVDLMKAGEAEDAVDSFLTSASSSSDPARSKRMYGMWYIDYLPYYQIALAHSKLGDWESAQHAIETSVSFGEFSPTDPDYGTFTDLDQLIKSHLQSNDS